jgi:hypothetical protein
VNEDTNLQIMMTRIEGKIDLVKQTQDHTSEDFKEVRRRLHEIANQVSGIMALNLGDRVTKLETDNNDCKSEREQRKGAFQAARIAWAAIGILGLGNMIALGKAVGVIHG